MKMLYVAKRDVASKGFAVIDSVYSVNEIESIEQAILNANDNSPTFRKTKDLFAVRQFFKEIPSVAEIVFNENFKKILSEVIGHDYFVVKSIYFDKPANSNWFVAYHQDLTISVDKKLEVPGFGPWTTKHLQFSVQPPLEILEENFTIRIHLDDTDENNGALKVIPKSHLKGIYRTDKIDWSSDSEVSCNVKQGGLMIMKPLLFHSSSKTTNNANRRVIHVEFSKGKLPGGLSWSELLV
jgi:ectoine hydroxylase-related dioxygenase (phytanoyl-CoA dioxygenase family)